MKNNFALKIILLLFISISIVACDSSRTSKTPIDQFIGTWELEGRDMFTGIQIEITKSGDNKIVGLVTKTNNDKYVQMFLEVGDVWVSSINRSSNYEFNLTEKKLAAKLFSIYGQGSSKEFKVQFIDKNTFGLGTGSSSPTESSILYKRKTSKY